MFMWLDDIRKPWDHGHIGASWVRTAQEAIALLKTGEVTRASLDHDLAEDHYPWNCADLDSCAGTGYDVARFLEENPQYLPKGGVTCHSANPAGRERIQIAIKKAYEKLYNIA